MMYLNHQPDELTYIIDFEEEINKMTPQFEMMQTFLTEKDEIENTLRFLFECLPKVEEIVDDDKVNALYTKVGKAAEVQLRRYLKLLKSDTPNAKEDD